MGAAWADSIPAQDSVDKVASGGMFKVQSSELALEQSQDANVQQFANMMIKDHRPNNEERLEIPKAEKLKAPPDLMPPQSDMMQELQDIGENGFNKAYLRKQVAAHEMAVTLYQSYTDEGDSQPLVNYAKNRCRFCRSTSSMPRS